jgi:hypothetical protein
VNGVYTNKILSYYLKNGTTFDTLLGQKVISSGVTTVSAFKTGVLDLSTEGLHVITVIMDENSVEDVDFNLGIDVTVPQFPVADSEAIIPSAGYHKDMLHVDVNAWDTLSGVSTVNIIMIDKITQVAKWNAVADYNWTTGLWFHDFNTELLDVNGNRVLPDSNYDIQAIVVDVAGNTAERTVDPGVDNTDPVINSIVVTGNPMVRENTITIDVNAEDNFSGVNTVLATISIGAADILRWNIFCSIHNRQYVGNRNIHNNC